MNSEDRPAYIELLRAVTRRMVTGSLLLKGWAVVLVAGLLALASNPLYRRWGWLALAFAIAFWILDAHLLRQARLYQKAQRRARLVSDAQVDFTLDTSAVDNEADAWRMVMFSKTLVAFYGAVLGSIALVRLLLQ